MNAPAPETPLRPLGLGEVLDRAVNLCVKHFVPLTMVFLVYAIPFAFVQYFATKDFSRMIQVMVEAVQSGKAVDQTAMERELNGMTGINPWSPLLLLLAFFVYPLPLAALIITAAGFYLGKPVAFGAAYRAALSRWPHLIGVNIMYGFAGGFVYFIVIVLVFVLALGIGFLYSMSSTAGIIVGIVIGTAALLVMIAFIIVAVLAWEISTVSCVVEQLNLAIAFVKGITRVFSGIGLRRSLLVGFAFTAILLGIELVAGLGEVLVIGVLKSDVAGTIYTTLVRLATAAFTTAFIAIFYFDLRVREEGLDLQLAAQAAQTEAPASV